MRVRTAGHFANCCQTFMFVSDRRVTCSASMINDTNARFDVLKSMAMKMSIVWDVTTYNVVDIYRQIIANFCLLL